jgi:hypothetical protein
MAMPPVQTRIVGVQITNDPAAPSGFGFAFNPGNPNTIQFANNNFPGFMVYFRINDIDNTGLLFPPDPQAALSVQLGGAMPQPWGGFVPLSVENNGQKLIVYCRNENPPTRFKFTLWFMGPGGPVSWDPIGDGLNGPRGGF